MSPHLQGKKISQARNLHEAGSKVALLATCFLLGLFFDPEDHGDPLKCWLTFNRLHNIIS
jgi:hypothetical protein